MIKLWVHNRVSTMGMSIKGEAMVGFTKRTCKTMSDEMLGIQIPSENKVVLDG